MTFKKDSEKAKQFWRTFKNKPLIEYIKNFLFLFVKGGLRDSIFNFSKFFLSLPYLFLQQQIANSVNLLSYSYFKYTDLKCVFCIWNTRFQANGMPCSCTWLGKISKITLSLQTSCIEHRQALTGLTFHFPSSRQLQMKTKTRHNFRSSWCWMIMQILTKRSCQVINNNKNLYQAKTM